MKCPNEQLPRSARWLFALFLPESDYTYLSGDYEEIYRRMCADRGRGRAACWLLWQMIKSLPLYIFDSCYWSGAMIKNYLLVAFRNFKNHKGYSTITIAGLALSLTILLVIVLYIVDEVTYDRFHKNAGNIYRVLSVGKKRGTKNSITAGPLVIAIKENIPEIRHATRVSITGSLSITRPGTATGEKEAVTAQGVFADPDFLRIFSFKILAGAGPEALSVPGSVFLTPPVAAALFAAEDPIGQPLQIADFENSHVAGIVEAPPPNSHIQFEALVPLIASQRPIWWDSWENLGLIGYVELAEGADQKIIEQKMNEVAAAHNFAVIFEPRLQPLLDVHLGSADYFYDSFNRGKNDRVVVYTLGVIGILILLVACSNFINLSTARATQRAREVGLRKVVGSSRRRIIAQFLGESVAMTALSFFLALLIFRFVAPEIQTILNKELPVGFRENGALLSLLFLSSLLIGLLSGIYPSLVLSAFKPIEVLRGAFHTSRTGTMLRRVLVIVQFVITTSLILGVLIIFTQLKFLRTMDMGYDREQVLVVVDPVRGEGDPLKTRLAGVPSILSTGRIDALPGPNFLRTEIIPEGFDRTNNFTASNFKIDEDLFPTLGISLSAGRNYSFDFSGGSENAVIVNRTLVEKSNYENPVGMTLDLIDDFGNRVRKQIIGVTEDFHYLTSRQKIEPMIFFFDPANSPLLLVKLAAGNLQETIAVIEGEYRQLHPDRTMRYFFLDETFDAQFRRDRDFARNIGIFAGIAIAIACLGLIGLVSYMLELRRKEIVVRKVLGCGQRKIALLLLSDFLKWVLLAIIIAWPCGYFAMRMWLNGFVYRVPFRLWPFLIACCISIGIALLTILAQTLRGARTDPAEVLRQIG